MDVKHIVALYGYNDLEYAVNVYYTETGQSAQGFYGTYWNNKDSDTFYGYVNAHSGANNSQVW